MKLKYPGILNTEVARLLGDTWRKLSFEEKEKYRAIEKAAWEKYKILKDDWKIKEAHSKSISEAHHEIKTQDMINIQREQQQAKFNIQNFQALSSQYYSGSKPKDQVLTKWMAYEMNRRKRLNM